jgi:hypothetical protein
VTEQTTAEITGQQGYQLRPAQHNALAILALVFGILIWPLGIYLGHASCQEAVQAGRKRSAVAIAGMVVGYAGVTIAQLLIVSGLIAMATGYSG